MGSLLNILAELLVSHSLRIAVVFVIVAAVCRLTRSASAHWRYMLWLIVILAAVAPPIVTVPVAVLPGTGDAEQPEPTVTVNTAPAVHPNTAPAVSADTTPPALEAEPMEAPDSPAIAAPSLQPPVDAPAAPVAAVAESRPALDARAWAALVWIVGATACLAVTAIKAALLTRRLTRSRRSADPAVVSAVAEAAKLLPLARPPRVWRVDRVATPFVWGLWRGDLYLPASFDKLPPTHRRSVLLHELAHVARRDAAVNLLQEIAQAVLFFHPLVWIANRHLRTEREKCCDETAVAVSDRPAAELGEAIVQTLIAEHDARRPLPSLAIAGPAKNIEERIRTMMSAKNFRRRPSMLAATVAIALAALLVPSTLTLTARHAAASDKPQAEVARSYEDKKPQAEPNKYAAVFKDGTTVELLGVRKVGQEPPALVAP